MAIFNGDLTTQVYVPKDWDSKPHLEKFKLYDISSIIIDPNENFIMNILSYIGPFSKGSYNPSLIEQTVSNNPLIPIVTTNDFKSYISKVNDVKN